MTNFEVRNKTLFNDGKIVLVQVGKTVFKLKLEREITTPEELSAIIDHNDVYLLKKGE